MDLDRLGFRQPLQKPVFLEGIHQEPDGATVHAVNGLAPFQAPVQAFEHEAVAAKRDDDVGLFRGHRGVAPAQASQRFLGFRSVGGGDGDGLELHLFLSLSGPGVFGGAPRNKALPRLLFFRSFGGKDLPLFAPPRKA